MPDVFPPIGVQAVIAGMAAFNRDAAIVEGRLLAINRVTGQMEAESSGAFGAAGTAFSGMAATLATGATLIAGGLTLAGAASIKFAADFQQGLALTKALTGATDEQMAGLSQTIIDLSRHGTLGMQDLASAATELGRSGVSLTDIMGGALKAVQDLTIASGGEIGLADAAKLTATAMQAFGISAQNASEVTTAATVVAQNSALTFTDFGKAVGIAGAPFASVGFSVNDLAIATALLGRNAMQGTQGPTALRNIIQRLEKPSKDAKAVMQEYGISLFDASGKAVSLRDLLAQLHTAFGDQAVAAGKLTEQERDQALATLFLQRAGAAALILTREGTQGYDELAASFENLKAEDLVNILLEPLNAQLKIAANNVLALAFAFGQEFLPPLGEATKGVVAFLQSISTDQAASFAQAIIAAATGIIQFGANVVTTFGNVISAFGLGDAATEALKSTLVGLGILIGGILTASVVGFIAKWLLFVGAIGAITVVAAKIDDAIRSIGTAFANWVSQFGPVGMAVSDLVRSISDGFGALGALFRGDFTDASRLGGLAVYEFGQTVQKDGGAALQFLQDRLAETGAAWAPWAAQAGPAGDSVSAALQGVSGVILSLQFLLQGNLPAAGAAAQQAFKDFQAAIEPVTNFLNNEFQAAVNWVITTGWPSLQSAATDVVAYYTGTVVPALQGIANEILTDVQPAVNWWINTGWPGLQTAATDVVAYIQGTAIPALQAFANEINTDVIPSLNNLSTSALPTAGNAFSAFGTTVNSNASALGTLNSNLFQTLNPLQDLTNGWNNLQASGTFLRATLTNLGIAFNQILGPVAQLVGAVANWLAQSGVAAAFIGGPFVAAILAFASSTKLVTLAFEGITLVIRQVSESAAAGSAQFVAFTQEVGDDFSTLGTVTRAVSDGIGAAFSALGSAVQATLAELQGDVTAAMTTFQGTIVGVLNALPGTASSLALAIGTAIVSGLVSGINARAHDVAAAATALVTNAISAAKAALGVSSPSRVFQQIGDDTVQGFTDALDSGQSDAEASGEYLGLSAADGLITALDKSKAPVRGSAASLVDQLISSFDSIESQAEQALQSTGDKMASVGETVGRKINEAIQDAADQIAKVQQDAANRIADLQDNLSQSRSDQARRDALSKEQDAARTARKQQQEDADAAAAHQKDIDDAAFKKKQDLDKAAAKRDQDLSQATTQKQKDAATAAYDDAVAKANETYKLNLDTIARNFAASEKDRLDKRQRETDDAAFEKQLAQQTADLNTKLEDEALQRSIERAQRDRDARIDAINQALTTKEQKLRADAQAELQQLNDNINKKLAALQNDFANKAAEILRKGGAQMQPLIDQITAAISNNFGIMTGAASGFLAQVNAAIGALNKLNAIKPPNIPSPGQGIGNSSGGEAPAAAFTSAGGGGELGGSISQGGGGGGSGGLHVFGKGGIVPGPYGKPMLAIVHGGEFVTALGSEASRLARQMTQYQPQVNRTYNYNVNASYSSQQSAASVEQDMRALIMLSRGS